MSLAEGIVILVVAVLAFIVGLIWGVYAVNRNWRVANKLIRSMHLCTGEMAREVMRLRDMVEGLGGDPGPAPRSVVLRVRLGEMENGSAVQGDM